MLQLKENILSSIHMSCGCSGARHCPL